MSAERSEAVSPEALIERVEELTAQTEMLPDPQARRVAEDLISAVMDMYGEGLTRIVEILEEKGDAAADVKQRLVDDGIVASLLLIHDLYPVPVGERVAEALEGVRPYMESHGGNVELISLEDGVARLRLEGSCDGCPASSSTLELAIKSALDEAAPDLVGIEVENLGQDLLNPVKVTGTALPMAEGNGAAAVSEIPPPPGANGWHPLNGEVDGLARGPAGPGRRGGEADRGREGRGLPARLPGFVPELRGIDRRGRARRGHAGLPRLRAAVLPSPGRPLARRRQASPRPRSPAEIGEQGVRVALAG